MKHNLILILMLLVGMLNVAYGQAIDNPLEPELKPIYTLDGNESFSEKLIYRANVSTNNDHFVTFFTSKELKVTIEISDFYRQAESYSLFLRLYDLHSGQSLWTIDWPMPTADNISVGNSSFGKETVSSSDYIILPAGNFRLELGSNKKEPTFPLIDKMGAKNLVIPGGYLNYLTVTVSGADISLGLSSENNYTVVTTPLRSMDYIDYSQTAGKFVDIQYYNGIGKETQTVQRGIAPNLNDLVSLLEYDMSGRKSKAWLPGIFFSSDSPVDTSFLKDGSKKTNGNDSNTYNKFIYEASPQNRLLEEYGAGKEWHNGNRSIKTSYLTNVTSGNAALICQLYCIDDSDGMKLVKENPYADGQLYVTCVTNEDGANCYEFQNKYRQVVLTRVQDGAEYSDTYFVYDHLGNLRLVLPPLASDALKNEVSWPCATTDAIRLYAYQYIYDTRNRCVEKKLPGVEPIRMIYDNADHLLFTQDGEQRKTNLWSFTITDKLNRTVLTGICSDVSSTSFADRIVYGVFDENSNVAGTGYRVENASLPAMQVYSINYYDDYRFLALSPLSTIKDSLTYVAQELFSISDPILNAYQIGDGKNVIPASTLLSLEENLQPASALGLQTGSRTFYLGEEDAMGVVNVTYYDARHRTIQELSTNHLGGYEKNYYNLSFSGQILYHLHKHTVPEKELLSEAYIYKYDHADRLLSVLHNLNGGGAVKLCNYTYDLLGRQINKSLHGKYNTRNYYNVRGWLKGISSDAFSQDLLYTESGNGNTPCYNGNISSMTWRVGAGETTRGYNFTYDKMSRLLSADYRHNGIASPNYRTSYAYNKMGSITSLSRWGLSAKPNTFKEIDKLTFTYTGNQLKNVKDAASSNDSSDTDAFSFKDGSNVLEEYAYDANGNLIQDLNKKITRIQYNLLNLPKTLQFENGSMNGYLYSADGAKRKMTKITSSGSASMIDYCGNVIYENGVLSKILTEEGYITLEGNTPVYHYYIADHQGNNRVVINQDGVVEQANHYYPYGGLFGESTASGVQPYKYNGKELDNTNGLGWYDYGARNYDPASLQFLTLDPLCEKSYSTNPYAYCISNPVNRVDPTGMASTYNWSTSRYEDESGNEVSWQEVMAEYKIGIDEESVDEDPPSKGNVDGITGAARIVKNYNGVYFPSGGIVDGTTGAARIVKDHNRVYFSNGGIFEKKEGNVFVPALPLCAAAGESVGVVSSSALGVFVIIPVLFQSDTDSSTPYVKAANKVKKKASSDADYGTPSAEHTANKRNSTENMHEKGQKRKDVDRGGEKGDKRRTRYK